MQVYKFILIGMAVWRLSSLLANEDGPFDVFARIRNLLGVKYRNEGGELGESFGTNWISKGIICTWCVSVWVGAIVALSLSDDFVTWLIHTLALSTTAIIIDSKLV